MRLFAGGRIRSFSLLFTDIVFLSLSIFLVFFVYKQFGALYELSILYRLWPIVVLMVIFNISGRLYCGNLIYPGLVINPVEELRRLTLSCIGSFLVFFAILSVTRENLSFSRMALVISIPVSALLLPLGRMILRYVLWKLRLGNIPAVIVGDPELAKSASRKMAEDNYCVLTLKASCCGEKIAENVPEMDREELKELLARLREQIAQLDEREPRNMESEEYEAWGEAHEELEDLVDDILDRLEEMD